MGPQKGIKLTDAPDLYRTVAEHTLALTMAALMDVVWRQPIQRMADRQAGPAG